MNESLTEEGLDKLLEQVRDMAGKFREESLGLNELCKMNTKLHQLDTAIREVQQELQKMKSSTGGNNE